MSSDDLVTVANYGSPQEAFIAKGALEAHDISACVMGAESTTWLWYVGTALGGVNLQVSKSDAARAAEILRTGPGDDESGASSAWKCPRCQADVDAGFDICWSCGASADELSQLAGADVPKVANDQATGRPLIDDDSIEYAEEASADKTALRAFRAAVYGIFFFPLLLYSAFLVVRLLPEELSPKAMRYFYATVAIIFVTIVILWTFFSLASLRRTRA